jgi:heat shock protein HslJ
MRAAPALVALTVAGCAEAPPPALTRAEPKPLEGIYWRLSALGGEEPEPGVSLTFDGERLRGEGPCNRYFGGYVLDEGVAALGVGAVAATRRACPRLDFEQRYFALLTEVKGYRIEHATLTLLDAEGAALMTFEG